MTIQYSLDSTQWLNYDKNAVPNANLLAVRSVSESGRVGCSVKVNS
ncbi:hypothetical protein [Psychromonas hadalis]